MIAHLSDIGFLGPRLTINHGIWLTDQDIELLARHHCSVTHNPLSNLKIGSGVCRGGDLASAGVNIALGTGGVATSDTADMIAVLRSATMLHTVTDPDFDRWVSAREAFRMATRGGATSGLMAADLGELAVGRKADMVLLVRAHAPFLPLPGPVREPVCSDSR